MGSAGDWGNFYQGCDRGCGSRLLLGLLGREEAQGSAGASGMRLLLELEMVVRDMIISMESRICAEVE